MEYNTIISNKIVNFKQLLSGIYDTLLQSRYNGDITELTQKKILNKDDKFFLEAGTDIETLAFIYDKISETNTVQRIDLLTINLLYKKYMSYISSKL